MEEFEPVCYEDGCTEAAVGSRPSAIIIDDELDKLVNEGEDRGFVQVDELVCYKHLMGD